MQNIFLLISLAIMVVAIMVIVWSTFMLHRNRWVAQVRLAILDLDFDTYKKLPDYDVMMKRWWVWDVTKFLP